MRTERVLLLRPRSLNLIANRFRSIDDYYRESITGSHRRPLPRLQRDRRKKTSSALGGLTHRYNLIRTIRFSRGDVIYFPHGRTRKLDNHLQ